METPKWRVRLSILHSLDQLAKSDKNAAVQLWFNGLSDESSEGLLLTSHEEKNNLQSIISPIRGSGCVAKAVRGKQRRGGFNGCDKRLHSAYCSILEEGTLLASYRLCAVRVRLVGFSLGLERNFLLVWRGAQGLDR